MKSSVYLHSQNIPLWISHIPSEQEPHVASGTVLDSVGLDLTRLVHVVERGPASPEFMAPQRRVNKIGVLLARKKRGMVTGVASNFISPTCTSSHTPWFGGVTTTYLVNKRNMESFWTPFYSSFL